MEKTCITCNSNGPFKPRNKTCNECILKRNTKCPHGIKEKRNCKDCGGGNICPHNKEKRFCADYNGSALCQHKKNKNICKECKGNQICQDSKERPDEFKMKLRSSPSVSIADGVRSEQSDTTREDKVEP